MRKPREAPPPAQFIRSCSGTVARLRRTAKRTSGGLWLYRLCYGDVVGHQYWTVADLQAAGVQWLRRRPRGWRVGA